MLDTRSLSKTFGVQHIQVPILGKPKLLLSSNGKHINQPFSFSDLKS